MSCTYRLRFLHLVNVFEKIPPELAGEFSPERIAGIIGCKIAYASKLIQEWLRGEYEALTQRERELMNAPMI